MALKLASSSAGNSHSAMHNANALRVLAARCAADMEAGRETDARAVLRFENLVPIELGYVAICMLRHGVPESKILTLLP